MEIIQASYLISSPSLEKCPPADRPEYAFIGRSNVGKSSLINSLTKKKELAKVSSTPGKTQMINHFDVISQDRLPWYIVDLPGYGFARVSQSQRKNWKQMIADYVQKRENLITLFALVDSRINPQKNDLDFINQLGAWQIPFNLVFTKADKVTQKEVSKNVSAFLNELKNTWEELPQHFVTSATKHTGMKQLLTFIDEQNKEYRKHTKAG